MGALPVVTFLETGSATSQRRRMELTWGRTDFSVSSSPFSSPFCLRFLLPIRSRELTDDAISGHVGRTRNFYRCFRVFRSSFSSPFHHVPLHSQAGVSLCSPLLFLRQLSHVPSLPLPPVSHSRQPGLRLHHQNSRPLRRGWLSSFRKKLRMYVPTTPTHVFANTLLGQGNQGGTW